MLFNLVHFKLCQGSTYLFTSIQRGYRRWICCNFHFPPKLYWSYSTLHYVAILPIEKLPFLFHAKYLGVHYLSSFTFIVYLGMRWLLHSTFGHTNALWKHVGTSWTPMALCTPNIESHNIVDFQEGGGRNSNQVVGELPTTGWISNQWLEIHPR